MLEQWLAFLKIKVTTLYAEGLGKDQCHVFIEHLWYSVPHVLLVDLTKEYVKVISTLTLQIEIKMNH